ncbi:ArsR family transcriptional regulator [Candidatus Woesearchaeota archaeon]|nr:ArsR family transcriptional regulator [Candidatus Woesearchaeota archaeon]
MEEKFILVSLNEKKSRDIATVIANATARKILDHLSEKEKVSPLELSKKLQVPLSTITHALKLLEKEGLIIRADHAWSEKGRKVSLYSLAKKMILIVPKGYDWKESLKKMLPIFLIGAVVSLALKIFFSSQETSFAIESAAVITPTKEMSLPLTDTTFSSTIVSLPSEAWIYTLSITFIIVLIIFIYDLRRKRT